MATNDYLFHKEKHNLVIIFFEMKKCLPVMAILETETGQNEVKICIKAFGQAFKICTPFLHAQNPYIYQKTVKTFVKFQNLGQ